MLFRGNRRKAMTKQISLEERITRLEDIEEIKKLKAKYALFLDDGYDAEKIAGIFAEDGEWIIEDFVIKGQTAIKEQCRKLVKAQPWSCHNITPAVIEIDKDGRHAVGIFYVLAFLTMKNDSGKDEAFFLPGIFKDKFVKINGQWLFRKVEGLVRQAVPWTKGWVKGKNAKGFFNLKN